MYCYYEPESQSDKNAIAEAKFTFDLGGDIWAGARVGAPMHSSTVDNDTFQPVKSPGIDSTQRKTSSEPYRPWADTKEVDFELTSSKHLKGSPEDKQEADYSNRNLLYALPGNLVVFV